MLTLTTIVLASTFALCPADRSAPTKEVGGGVAGVACSCTGDLDQSGTTDASDLALLLGAWGGAAGDLDGSGSTDAADLAVLLGAWGPCPSAPANNNCSDAIEVGEGVYDFCTIGATIDGPAYGAGSPCAEFNYANIFADVWYSYTAIGDGELTISTCGTTWDTRLAIYGSVFGGPIGCPGGEFSLVGLLGCNDDAPNCNFASKLTIPVIGGRQYKIRVGGFNGFTGVGTLSVDFTSAGSSCFDAVQLPNNLDGQVFVGTTLDNNAGPDESPCGLNDTVDEWYTFENTCPGEFTKITISTCNELTDFDTVVTVWKQGLNGCTQQLIECNDDATGSSCQIGGLNRKSRLTFFPSPGAIYTIRVSGYNGASGNFGLGFTVENCGL